VNAHFGGAIIRVICTTSPSGRTSSLVGRKRIVMVYNEFWVGRDGIGVDREHSDLSVIPQAEAWG